MEMEWSPSRSLLDHGREETNQKKKVHALALLFKPFRGWKTNDRGCVAGLPWSVWWLSVSERVGFPSGFLASCFLLTCSRKQKEDGWAMHLPGLWGLGFWILDFGFGGGGVLQHEGGLSLQGFVSEDVAPAARSIILHNNARLESLIILRAKKRRQDGRDQEREKTTRRIG